MKHIFISLLSITRALAQEDTTRLRDRIGPTVLLSHPPQSTQDPLCCEAADEIERLRAELAAERERAVEKLAIWREQSDADERMIYKLREALAFYGDERVTRAPLCICAGIQAAIKLKRMAVAAPASC